MRAILFVVKILGDRAKLCHVHFRIDNTTIIGGVSRQRSPNFILNTLSFRLNKSLKSLFGGFSIAYCKSCNNHADWYSRIIKEFSCELPEQVDAAQSFVTTLFDALSQQLFTHKLRWMEKKHTHDNTTNSKEIPPPLCLLSLEGLQQRQMPYAIFCASQGKRTQRVAAAASTSRRH